jgi:type II secretory pathway pseudopilin PulG
MGLQGQVARRDSGYAMAAMLVAIGILSVIMTVAMPAWRHMVQREKEEELIFRGQQYARSIGLFQRKYAAAYPPDVDTLVRQKFLRKKYKDPMAPDGEFQVLYQSSLGQPATPGQPTGGQRGRIRGSQEPQESSSNPPPFANRPAGGLSGTVGPRGGVIGVASTSTAESIRVYNGRSRYNEWQFVYTPSMFGPGQPRPGMRPGVGRPGAARPGQGTARPSPRQPGGDPR